MAIIYTYPNLPLSSLSAEDLLVITNVDATNNNPTRSVTLADIATYVTGTGGGTGTTNKIVKFTDGANGLLGDSIMTESTGLIDLAGQFVSTSSPTLTQVAPVSGIKAILNSTTSAPNIALYGESKHTGGVQTDSNYGLFAKGEFEGTGGFTGFVIGGNLEGRYDGTGTNGANATVYGSYNLARATTAANGTVSYMIGANNLAKVEGTNVVATNLQATHSTVELSNGTAGDVIVQILDFDTTGGGTVTGDLSYLQIQNDTMPTVAGTSRAINSKSVLPSLFTGQVEIPLVPTINAHATSKQYVDQQISSVVSGLVFISTWDASSTPGGNPDLTDASTQVVGHYYVVSVAGNATPNGAGTLPNSWNVGDWCIYVEQGATDRWEKLDQTFVSGAGAAGQVTYWNSQNEVAGDNNFFWDNTNKRLGIGITIPERKLHLHQGDSTLNYIQITNDTTGQGGGDGVSFGITSNEVAIWNNREATDTSISTNNIERMVISSAGDISISPRGTAASSGSGILYFKNVDDNSATINGASIRTVDSTNNPSGADMRFQVANDNGALFDVVTIDSNGFVGIGNMSPDVELDVSGKGRFQRSTGEVLKLNSTTVQGCFATWENNNTDIGYIGSSFHLWASPNNIPDNFAIRANTQLDFGVGNNVYTTILSSGNVGIGTTSPSANLDILNGTTGASLKLSATSTAYWQLQRDPTTGNLNISDDGIGNVMSLDQVSGNVGIGTVNPTTKLEINANNNGTTDLNLLNLKRTWSSGTSTDRSHGILFSDNNSSMATIYADRTNSGANYDSDLLFATNTGTNGTSLSTKMIIKNTGNVGIGTTSPDSLLHVSADVTGANTGTITIEGRPTGFLGDDIATIDFHNNGSKLADIRMERGNAADDSQLVFSTSDTGTLNDALIINEIGNVGIGTTSPDAKLDVNGGVNGTHAIFSGQDGRGLKISTENTLNNDDGVVYDAQTSTGKHLFKIAGTERMRIDSSGDISIQKTTGSVFNLRRDDTSVVAGDGLGSIFFQGNDPSNPYKSGAAILAQGDGTWNMGTPNVYPSRLIFQTAEENTLKTAMVIKSDQKVGIGTTTPSYTLVVSDNGGSGVEFIPQTTNNRTTLLSYNRSGSAYNTLDFDASDIHFNISGSERMQIDSSSTTKITSDGTNTAGTILELHFPNNNSTDRCATINLTNNVGGYAVIEGGTTGANNSGYIAFKTDNAGTQGERMRIDPAGNVLFGTTGVPNGTSIYGSGFVVASNSRRYLNMATSSTALNALVYFFNPNGTVGYIATNGSATVYNTSSDYRLKEDLKDFNGLDKVSKIPVYDFKWKVDDSRSYGVLAHELEEVIPNAVSGEKDAEEMQGVDYSKIVPLLIKSIQELEAKVKILENK